MDLKDTVRRCQAGEKEAFRTLYQAVEKKALATAYLLSGNKGIAEDILQETYIKSFMEIKNLREPDAYKLWFYRTLVRTGWELSKKYSNLIPTGAVLEDETAYKNPDMENMIDSYETRQMVQNAVNGLSKNLKTTIILFYYNCMTIKEISKIQGCLPATVKSRLFYARTILKKQLGNYFMYDSEISDNGEKECSENA